MNGGLYTFFPDKDDNSAILPAHDNMQFDPRRASSEASITVFSEAILPRRHAQNCSLSYSYKLCDYRQKL